jgi:hypothetical protein
VFHFAQLHTELVLGKNNNTPSTDDDYGNRRATKTKNTIKFTNYDLRLASVHYITLQLQITLQVHVMACHITDTTHHGGVTSLAVTLTVTVESRHITVDLQLNRHVICHGGWQVAVQASHGKPYSCFLVFFFLFWQIRT